MPFQTQVYSRQAPAVVGDFASDNPREFYPAGPGGLVAGASGVTIGSFAWVSSSYLDWDSGPTIVNNFGYGIPSGIVHRNQVGINSTYLSEASLGVLSGQNVSLLTGGDIWLKNSGSSEILAGYKAYANLATGAVTFALTGTATAAASAATASIAAGTAATFTGSISGNVLTTSGTVTNTIYPGAIVTGGTVATGTYVVSQLSGTTGGSGTYQVNIPEQTVASASLTATPSIFTPGTMQAGTVAIGNTIVTSGVNSSTYTTSSATTGTIVGMVVMAAASASTWSLAPAFGLTAAGTLTSGTVVVATNVETKWYALNAAAAGELVRCGGTRLS